MEPFKGIISDDISEFEPYMPSHAVRSPPAQKWHCTARSPHSGPPSAASSICRETTTLLRSTLILAAMLVASLTSASIAACAKHSEHEKSFTRERPCGRGPSLRASSSVRRVDRGVRHKSVDLDGVGALDLDRFELRILNDEVLAAGHHVIHFARVDFRNDTRVFGMRRRS